MSIIKPPVIPVWAESGDVTTPTSGEIQAGWPATSTPPTRQRFNWILNFCANAARYFSRRGMADWDSAETYAVGDYTRGPDGLSYRSLTANTNKTPASNPSDWVRWGFTAAEMSAALTLLPAGVISAFGASAAPTGWLKCDGSAVSRTTYAALFTAIGTTFGAGNGTTTFNLPDLRGEFLRGWDDGRGVDSGRSFGSAQSDAFKSHDHTYPEGFSGGGSGSQSGPTSGGTLTTNSTGGTETRPRNIAALYIIKY